MKFTKLPASAFQNLQLGAGVLLSDFDPATATVAAGSLLGATSGGVSFTAEPSFSDFGEDIDNCPKNMMELKRLDSWEAQLSGTFVTISAPLAKTLLSAADVSGAAVTPRSDLTEQDFTDLWWVGDYSDRNGESGGGFVAIHMKNTLSTGGFQLKSGDKQKGNFDFEFTAHYSMEDQTAVPFAVYVRAGEEEPAATES